MPEVMYPEITVALTGEDGNAFLIIGRVAGAIRRSVDSEASTEFFDEATQSTSYSQLLDFVMRTVNVT